MANKYYAVKAGRKTGIYETWEECKEQIDGYKGQAYKSFKSLEDAYEYMGYTSAPGCDHEGLISGADVMTAYVDGSYNDEAKEFSYGMIAFVGKETIRDSKAYKDETLVPMRNVAGEIKGAETAMKLAIERKCRTLHIYHDYEGIAKWPLGEWRAGKEGTIAYKEFYDSIKPELTVIFHKVTGHSGNKYNDEADALAKSALKY